MHAALTIALKDLRERMRDRSALLIAFVVPLGLAAILNLTIGQAASGDLAFDFALANEDGGEVAASFERDVLSALAAEGVITLRPAASIAEARALAERGDVGAAFVLPEGFTAAVRAGEASTIRVIGDVDAPIATQVATSIARAFTEHLRAVQLATAAAVVASGTNAVDAAALAARAATIPPHATLTETPTSSRELDFTTSFAAGLSAFFLLFTVQFGLSSIVDERRDATLLRLLAAPISRWTILGGKALTSVVLGLASMTVLFVATTFLLDAHWGAPAGVGLLIAAGVLAATGITALTATLARTAEQVASFQAIAAVVLGMLGGSFFPLEQVGGVLTYVSRITPHYWFLHGLGDAQVSAGQVLPAAGVLLVIAAVTSAGAALRLERLTRP